MAGEEFAAELESAEPYDFGGDPDGVTLESVVPVDWALDVLLGTLFSDDPASQENSFGITASVSGTVVSGLVIHGAQWERLWAQEVERSSPEIGQTLHLVLATTRTLSSRIRSRREAERRPNVAVKHLHLRDAVLWCGAEQLRVGLWRCRLDLIAGWSPTRTIP